MCDGDIYMVFEGFAFEAGCSNLDNTHEMKSSITTPQLDTMDMVERTALQSIELGLIWEAQQLPGISPQDIDLQNGVGGGRGQHIPHGVVLRNGLGLACQPDVPPVAHVWHLYTQDTCCITQRANSSTTSLLIETCSMHSGCWFSAHLGVGWFTL